MSDDTNRIQLGPCCICEGTKNVNNIISLDSKSPTPGKGWGCVICNLPTDGAVAVLCDDCLAAVKRGEAQIKFACAGYPIEPGRVPVGELTGRHEHDMDVHRRFEARARTVRMMVGKEEY